MATPLSMRVSEEVKESFGLLKASSGMTPEDLMLSMMENFKASRDEMNSPVSKELTKVKQVFATAERVVAAFLEIAENDKISAIDHLAAEKIVYLEAIKELKETNAELVQDKAALQAASVDQRTQLGDQVEELESIKGRLEDTSSLKEAWGKAETTYQARITELDVEAQASRQLATNKAALEKNVAELKPFQELAANFKKELGETQKQVVAHQKDIDVLQKKTNELDTKNAVLAEQKKSCEAQATTQIASLEREIALLERENQSLSGQVSLLTETLSKSNEVKK
ncbi:coiled-coil domain-containing protein [Desulfotalea psychrophila]|nr:hypothetical protein [Desulfotalea psychrophila]